MFSMIIIFCMIFFFFSSRRRHTRYWRDWSSDVCSSDLAVEGDQGRQARGNREVGAVVPLGGLHERAPDRPGGGPAEPGALTRERVPGPDGGRIQRGVADEPGVGEPLTGAGLAGLRRAA